MPCDARRFVREAIREYREVKAVRDMLENSVVALAGKKEAAALRQAVQELYQAIRNARRPVLARSACQEGMREVARLAAEYTRTMQEKTKGEKGADWEPGSESGKLPDACESARQRRPVGGGLLHCRQRRSR